MVTSAAAAMARNRRTAPALREWSRSTRCSTSLRWADVQLTIRQLEELLARVRPAVSVRQLLAAGDPAARLRRRRRAWGEGR
jgi:hypothetical protein